MTDTLAEFQDVDWVTINEVSNDEAEVIVILDTGSVLSFVTYLDTTVEVLDRMEETDFTMGDL